MSKILNKYLDNIQEGLWSNFLTMIESGKPKNEYIQALDSVYWKGVRNCNNLFPADNTNLDFQIGDYSFEYNHYKDDPKRVRCITKALISHYISMAELLKEPTKLCTKNRNTSRCIKWCEMNKFKMERYLKQAKDSLQQMDASGRMSKNNFNKLKKILG